MYKVNNTPEMENVLSESHNLQQSQYHKSYSHRTSTNTIPITSTITISEEKVACFPQMLKFIHNTADICQSMNCKTNERKIEKRENQRDTNQVSEKSKYYRELLVKAMLTSIS